MNSHFSTSRLLPISGVVLTACSVVAYWISVSAWIAKSPSLSPAEAQGFIFPFAMVGIYLLVCRMIKIPLLVLVLAVVASTLSVASVWQFGNEGHHSVVVSLLEGDSYGSETKIFRTSLERAVPKESPISITPYFASFASRTEALKHLKDSNPHIAIIYGSKRFIVALPARDTILQKLGDDTSPFFSRFSGFQMVSEVPAFGLSFKPADETARFLAEALAGDELSLLSAGSIVGGWTGYAHRAYSWFKLGNLYLLELISGDNYQYGALDCALRSYNTGIRFLRYGDNPELRAAITNNMGIALYIQGVTEKNMPLIKISKKLFTTAKQSSKEKGPFGVALGAATAAKSNKALLKHLHSKPKTRQKVPNV